MASNAQRSARLDSRARGSAALLMPCRHTCRQPVQRKRRTVTSKVVGRHPEWLVRQPPGHRVSRRSLASAAPAPPVELARLDPTGQHRTIGLEPLTKHLQAELVEAAERAEIRAHEGSVKHVEVFRMDGVRTPIIERP